MFLLLLLSELFHPSAPPPPVDVLVQIPTMALAIGQSPPTPPPAVKLEVRGGDVRVVKVDKVIVVKEDVTVASSFPFELIAPPGAATYSWQTPAGTTFYKRANVLEVTSAPKGTALFIVEMMTIDFDARRTITTVGEIRLSIGGVTTTPPPINPPVNPPVDPPPPPTTEDKYGFLSLAKTEAEKIQNATEKAKASRLADNFDAMAAKLKADSTLTVPVANAELTKNNQSIGLDRPTWLPWFTAWKNRADVTIQTPEQYAQAFRETAAGLRAVR